MVENFPLGIDRILEPIGLFHDANAGRSVSQIDSQIRLVAGHLDGDAVRLDIHISRVWDTARVGIFGHETFKCWRINCAADVVEGNKAVSLHDF